MVLSAGKIKSDVGGGLCQLANLLTWIVMHSDLDIIERYHHNKIYRSTFRNGNIAKSEFLHENTFPVLY